VRDDQWERIKDALPGKSEDPGGTYADNRLFVEACNVDSKDWSALARFAIRIWSPGNDFQYLDRGWLIRLAARCQALGRFRSGFRAKIHM
jgi:hypothetical protein